MKKNSFSITIVAILVVGGTLMAISPGVRTLVTGKYNKVISWPEEAIQKDPMGYMKFVEKKLIKDQNKIQTIWRNLGISVGKLAKKQSKNRETLEQGMAYAEKFRDAYQNANGVFPVEILGESYTDVQLRAQLSLTLAQNDGLTQLLTEVDEALIDASSKMEELIVQNEKTETQLALIATKREMFQADALSTEGLQLVGRLNGLFEENELVMAGNPVRSIEQLVKAETFASKPANSVRVEEFLNANKKDKPAGTEIEPVEVVVKPLVEKMVSVNVPQKMSKKRGSNKTKQSQPIYQQSI